MDVSLVSVNATANAADELQYRHAATLGNSVPGKRRSADIVRTRAAFEPARTVFFNLRVSAAVQSAYGFVVADFPFEVIQ
jgi:hypothetical protein